MSLDRWSIFRAISVSFDKDLRLYVVLRSESPWYGLAVTSHADVENPEDMSRINPPKELASVLAAPGPLVRIIMARVKNTNTAGYAVIANHAVLDAISVGEWREDVERLLVGRPEQIQPRTPHKLFGDIYYSHETSLRAQIGVKYHLKRFYGIDRFKDALWPPQRCPAWFIGDDSEWQPSALEHGFGDSLRTQLAEGGWRVGFDGITASTKLTHLDELWAKHKISAPVVFKTACTLLNAHLTGK